MSFLCLGKPASVPPFLSTGLSLFGARDAKLTLKLRVRERRHAGEAWNVVTL